MNIRTTTALAAMLSAAAHPLVASAGSIVVPLNAVATVVANCAMNTAGALSFGAYDPIGANTTSTAATSTSVSAFCTKNAVLNIVLSGPDQTYLQQASAGGGPGPVTTATPKLFFTMSTKDAGPDTGRGRSAPVTVHVDATMDAGQDVPVGTYADNGANFVAFNF